jgi:hypothetical protein
MHALGPNGIPKIFHMCVFRIALISAATASSHFAFVHPTGHVPDGPILLQMLAADVSSVVRILALHL